jgi:hypothetical protein
MRARAGPGAARSAPESRALLLLGFCLALTPPAALPGELEGRGSEIPQKAALEAVNQELVRQRLGVLIEQIQALLRDLRANAALDPQTEAAMHSVLARIRALSHGEVAAAGRLLRTVADDPRGAGAGAVREAAARIDAAARELGCLILVLSVRFATEVAGRELHEVVVSLKELHGATLWRMAEPDPAAPDAAALAKRQTELAAWLTRLLDETATVQDLTADAVAVVRLSRLVKALREAGVEARLQAAAQHLGRSEWEAALKQQGQALATLFQAEFSIRPGAELEAIAEVRDRVKEILDGQKAVRLEWGKAPEEGWRHAAAALAARERTLARSLTKVVIPPENEERIILSPSQQPRTAPEVSVESLHAAALQAMRDAQKALEAARREEAEEAGRKAESAAETLVTKLEERMEQVMYLQLVMRRLRAAHRRLKLVRDLEDRQQNLIQDTEELEAAKKDCKRLAYAQDQLGRDAKDLAARIVQEDPKRAGSSKDATLLCRPLESAGRYAARAFAPLNENRVGEALPQEKAALEELHRAREAAELDVEALERMARFAQTGSYLQNIIDYLRDALAEQTALRAKTEAAQQAGTSVAALARPQGTLARAVEELSGILGQLSEAGQVRALLAQTQQAMEAAADQLGRNAPLTAVPQQKQAEQALGEAVAAAQKLAEQFFFLADWAAVMRHFLMDTSDLVQRQIKLRKETQEAEPQLFAELAVDQEMLRFEAETFGKATEFAKQHFLTAAKEMSGAIVQLKANDRAKALTHMAHAEEALGKAFRMAAAAYAAMESVPNLIGMGGRPMTPQWSLLLKVLMAASEERRVRLKTHVAAEPAMRSVLAPHQDKIEKFTAELVPASENDALIAEGHKEVGAALASLRAAARADAIQHEQLAEKAFRQYIILRLVGSFNDEGGAVTALQFGLPGDALDMRTSRIIEIIHLFAKAAVDGEADQTGETDWGVFGRRERAALNENFARELPLEHRDMLRDYYERLSR